MKVRNEKPLRIAHIQPIALDIFGHRDRDWGRSVRYFLTNIAAEQARNGDLPTVHLLTSFETADLEVEGVRVKFHPCLQLPRSWPVTARFGRQLSRSMLTSISRDQMDLIHFHGVCSLHAMYGGVVWKARREGVPVFGQDHGPRQGKLPERWLQSYGLQHSTAIFAANADSREQLMQRGIPRQDLHIVPNGFDPNIFFPGHDVPRAAGQPFRILVVSRLWEDKDPLTMARAVAEVAARGHLVELTVIGQGLLKSQVESVVKAANVSATFHEHIAQTDLAEYYRSSHALVLTSLREGWNQATIEAMACGLPVIASDIAGVRDGVADGGWLLPPGNATAFADALEQLITTPGLARDYRLRGLERSQLFTWKTVVSRFREVYNSYGPHSSSSPRTLLETEAAR